jgi:hypothetical protein
MRHAQKAAENAGILALEGLGWLAGSEGGLERFLTASGMDLAGLKDAAGSSDTGLAVLEFLLMHEDLLLAFCDAAGTKPAEIHAARRALARDEG